jgi:hypothetical protein
VAFEPPHAAPLLDEQLIAAIETHAGKPFARDLAIAAGLNAKRSGRAAEAS